MYISLNWLNTILNVNKIHTLSIFENIIGLAGFEIDEFNNNHILSKSICSIKLATTTNRSDVLSITGFCRELSFLLDYPWLNRRYKNIHKFILSKNKFNFDFTLSSKFKVKFYDKTKKACESIQIINIKLAYPFKIPKWMERRLVSAHFPFSNDFNDMIHYLLIEWGTPLQSFDLDKIDCNSNQKFDITINFIKDKKIIIDNGVSYRITNETLGIWINQVFVGIAGLLTLEQYQIGPTSKNILIIAPEYNSISFRRSSRSTGVQNEFVVRHERKVGYPYISISLKRLSTLMKIFQPDSNINYLYNYKQTKSEKNQQIEVFFKEIIQTLGLLGKDLNETKKTILSNVSQSLGLIIVDSNDLSFIIKIPKYRSDDLRESVDIIEEIARGFGFNNFPSYLPSIQFPGSKSTSLSVEEKIRRFLIGNNFFETMSSSFDIGGSNKVNIINPITIESSFLRSNLINGLLYQASYNQNQSNTFLDSFEFGSTFIKIEPNGKSRIFEDYHLAAVFGSNIIKSNWEKQGGFLTWFEAKGIVEKLLKNLNIFYNQIKLFPSFDSQFHPERAMKFQSITGKILGTFGQINPYLAYNLNISNNIYIFEFSISNIVRDISTNYNSNTIVYVPFSLYPAITVDLSILVDFTVFDYQKIYSKIKKLCGKDLIDIQVFDYYSQENTDKISLGLKLKFQSINKTFKRKDIEKLVISIKTKLIQENKIEFR